MKLINISTATVLLLFSTPAHALTLTEAINASLANNLSIKIENINVDLAEEDIFRQSQTTFHQLHSAGVYLKTTIQT